MKISLPVVLLLLIGGCSLPVAAQQCLEYGPTVSLTGTLHSRAFPGPPNYESIKRGDRKETAWLLSLRKNICTTGHDDIDVAESNEREVQLVIRNDAHWKTVRSLSGKRAIITGTLFHAHTGHHRTKVLIDVADIRRAGT
jgi:hypothetical protein